MQSCILFQSSNNRELCKKNEYIDIVGIDVPCLLQSKSYLKIIGITYYPHDDLSICLLSNDVKVIIKQNQIFDNIILASKSYVIKVLPKLDMFIVQMDIQDVQSGSKAKELINQCFNIGNHIATIRDINMNPGVLQCKNCWRWSHTTHSCRIQEAKCVKCSGLQKTEHHRQFRQCYKANNKINPSQLETKKGELCLHVFKCLNYHSDHQADSNQCPFWKYKFNCEWHNKKQVKIHENRNKLIPLILSGT